MSDIINNGENNENTEEINSEEESTVFSDPVSHKDGEDKHSPSYKRIRSLIIALACVLIVAGGIFAVIKFIPEKEENESGVSSDTNEITVLSETEDQLKTVKVTNKSGTFNFYSEKQKSSDSSESEETVVWNLEGVKASVLSSSAISGVTNSALDMTAIMEITQKTAAECELDNPKTVVEVNKNDGSSYKLSVGGDSPDGRGVYLLSSKDNKIYLVSEDQVTAFDFELLDLADTTAVPAATFDGDISEYTDSEGNIATFDSINISGAAYQTPIRISPNTDKRIAAVDYMAQSSQKHLGDPEKTGTALSLFTGTVSVSGAYSLDISNESINKFGLNNPDYIVTLSIKNQTRTYKFKKQEDGNYAFIFDGAEFIRKVYESAVTVANLKESDFYYSLAAPYQIDKLSSFTATLDGKEYKFDLSTTEDADGNSTLKCTYNGKQIKEDTFKDFYYEFVSISYCDFESAVPTENSLSIKLTFADGSQDVTVNIGKVSATKYVCNVDGESGRITAATYNKFIKALKKII